MILVTGASSGIGRATVEVLLEAGYRVFGSLRSDADAKRAQAELGARFTPLLMDVTDEASVRACADELRDQLGGMTLRGLVNNAGFCVVGPLLHQPIEDMRRQLEINTLGPVIVTQAFAPLLGVDRALKGKPGRIVNISSVGGRFGAPFLGAYAGSKHALEGMTESLRRELQLYGIDAILIEPGYVNTPILDKALAEDYSQYRHTDYAAAMERFRVGFVAEGRKGLHPRVIGQAVLTALTSTSPKVNYTVVKQKLKNWTIPMALPKRTVDAAIGKQLGLLVKR
ncbi:SDR family oxidoreductase [Roseateles chitinivorans]|uniref:SDR family oxidoreductase n=1 Tax=Roseateles chitinivorans TaxID=2917965 RepID=UPI003D6728A6